MHPEEAVRQLEYVVAGQLTEDSWSHWEESVYSEEFEYVHGHEDGTAEHVSELVSHLGEEIEDGSRPMPEDVREYSEELLTESGRPLTDGGE